MAQGDTCPFCDKGKYNRMLIYRIYKRLSREDMKLMLRWGWKIKGINRDL